MIQLYDKLPDDFFGGGMHLIDTGEYCKVYEAQPILNTAYAQIEFLLTPALRESGTVPLCRGLPDDVATITCDGSVYCNARAVQRHLNKLRAHKEFLREHFPTVGASAEERARHKPVRC